MENRGKEISFGRYIIFEGIDGCGKTTLINNFEKYLIDKGFIDNFIFTREPGNIRNKASIKIREILKENDLDKTTQLLLFMADRKIHYEELINDTLENKNVISDRSYLSSLAYQSKSEPGHTMNDILNLHRIYINKFRQAGAIVFLYVDFDNEKCVDEWLKRIRNRGIDPDYIENKTIEEYKAIQNNYIKYISDRMYLNPNTIFKVDFMDFNENELFEKIFGICI